MENSRAASAAAGVPAPIVAAIAVVSPPYCPLPQPTTKSIVSPACTDTVFSQTAWLPCPCRLMNPSNRDLPWCRTWTSVVACSAMLVKAADSAYSPAVGAVQRNTQYSPRGPGCSANRPGSQTTPTAWIGPLRAVVGDVRFLASVAVPHRNARHGGAATDEAEQTAVEHHDARVIQAPDQGQHVERMAEDRPVARLVQQPPHHDARMIPIAQDHLRDRPVESLTHLRRRLQEPAGKALLVDHQSQFVAQIELVTGGHRAEEADRVESHRLGQQQVAAGQVGIVRPVQPDGIVRRRVRTFQENALAVEAEVTVVKTKLAEAAAAGSFVELP